MYMPTNAATPGGATLMPGNGGQPPTSQQMAMLQQMQGQANGGRNAAAPFGMAGMGGQMSTGQMSTGQALAGLGQQMQGMAQPGGQNGAPQGQSGHGLFSGLFGGGSGSVSGGGSSSGSGVLGNWGAGYVGGGPLLSAASMVPGPVGMAAGGLNMARRAVNTVNTDNQLSAAGLQPLGPLQTAGAVTGLNNYATQNGLGQVMNNQGVPSSVTSFGDAAMAEQKAISENGLAGGGGMPMGTGVSGPVSTGTFSAGGDSNGGANNPGASDGGGAADGPKGREGWATGGPVTGPISGGRPAPPGLVRGSAPGTADTVMRQLPFGSFVIPAAAVSGMGGGNTAAGARTLQQALPQVAAHGAAGPAVNARVSSGEMVVSPQQLAKIGGGDPRKGMLLLQQMLGGGQGASAPMGMASPPMAR